MVVIKGRRLPVLNEQKRIVGILLLADIADARGPNHACETLNFPGPAAQVCMPTDGGR